MGRWSEFADTMMRSLERSERTIAKGDAYLYGVGSVYFNTAFAAYVSAMEWKPLLVRACELFHSSVEKNDCQTKDPLHYPFNQAQLLLSLYLTSGWLGENQATDFLDKAIDLTVDGTWAAKKQPVVAFGGLAKMYLLREDVQRLSALWEMLGKQTDLSDLPTEMSLWYGLYNGIYIQQLPADELAARFIVLYAAWNRGLKDPSDRLAGQYLSLAQIASRTFWPGLSHFEICQRLAVEPWEKIK